MIALLPLLLAVTSAAPVERVALRQTAERVATATVTIIRADPVTVAPGANSGLPDRQYRERDAMPLVEFY